MDGQYEDWKFQTKSTFNRLLLSLGTAFVVCRFSMTGVASSKVREISNEHSNYCSSGSIQKFFYSRNIFITSIARVAAMERNPPFVNCCITQDKSRCAASVGF